MAKRSDRRRRRQAPAAAPHPPDPEPAAPLLRTRQFWLGVLVAACLLVPVAVAAALLAGGDGDGQDAAAQTADRSVEDEAARIRRVTATRDKEQVSDLTERMRGFGERLTPVADGVARTLPPGRANNVGPLADRADVQDWIATTRDVRAFFEESVSGDTGTNVARGAYAAAARGLAEVVETYKLALEQPAARAALLERVRAQRDLSVRAWDTASVQLDAINIAAGFGHQHVPGLGAGAAPPDDLPEGTGAEP